MSQPNAPYVCPTPSTAADRLPAPPAAWVYMLRCPDGSLYTGWTNDLARRLKAHRTGKAGAKYTKSHGRAAVALAYTRRCADKSDALKQELALKKLTKPEKEALAAAWAAENTVTLRPATPADAAAILQIYHWHVQHSTASFEYRLPTVAEYQTMIAETLRRTPFLVACNAAGAVRGYAYAHPWHTREAYSWDAELTVYCAPDAVGQGLGRRLYTALLALLTRQGYCNAVALVAHPNPASEAMHRALGFKKVGTEPRTGYKFGQWLDLQYWWLPLREGLEPPAPTHLLGAEEVRGVLAGM